MVVAKKPASAKAEPAKKAEPTKKAAGKPVEKAPAKTAAKAKPAAKPAKAASEAAPAARKPNAAFMKELALSAELAAVVGKGPMARTEVTKKIWDYIKQHDLQDPANRRMINADAKLKAVFGGKEQVSMFEMTKLVSAHLK